MSSHESSVLEEKREENSGEQHADSEEPGTRHLLKIILEHLPN